MCGIAGCYQQADGQKLVDVMSDRIAHRGPDAAGTWHQEDGRVAVQLGHRRLSIIDLSAAADQPLSKHGMTLVYNGELYNYRALRAELAARGVRFATSSDTEVVLEAWRAWGPGALRRFRGMFAFALFDAETGDLILARDPLGIKPLYYLPRGGGVVFASELKALVAALGSELRIEPGALVASMLYYWLPEQRCAIGRVRKLPGGSWARVRPDGSVGVQHYWRPADVAAEAAAGPPADLGTVIEESVAAHLVSDVPVSSFLSGGLDSSIVTVLAHPADAGVDASTITFPPAAPRPAGTAPPAAVAPFLGARGEDFAPASRRAPPPPRRAPGDQQGALGLPGLKEGPVRDLGGASARLCRDRRRGGAARPRAQDREGQEPEGPAAGAGARALPARLALPDRADDRADPARRRVPVLPARRVRPRRLARHLRAEAPGSRRLVPRRAGPLRAPDR